MYLTQLLLPLYDSHGQALPKTLFAQVRDELLEQFGGLTAYTRAPVDGLWREDDKHAVHDDLIIYEVMACELDRAWWANYRASLETRFCQEQLLIRAQLVEML